MTRRLQGQRPGQPESLKRLPTRSSKLRDSRPVTIRFMISLLLLSLLRFNTSFFVAKDCRPAKTFASPAEDKATGENFAQTSVEDRTRASLPPVSPASRDTPTSKPNTINKVELNPFDFITNIYFEYEERCSSGCKIQVSGRLHHYYEFWKSIKANSFVLDIIKNGYILPFYETPAHTTLVENPKHGLNNRSAINHSKFVTEAISELIHSRLNAFCLVLNNHS